MAKRSSNSGSINANFLMVGAGVVALIVGLYLYNTRINGSADVLSSDPAYADGASIDSSLDAEFTQIDNVDSDLSQNDADLATF